MSKTGALAVLIYAGVALWMRHDAARGEWGPLSEIVAGLAVAPVSVPLELVGFQPSVQRLTVWVPMFAASVAFVYSLAARLAAVATRLLAH